MEWQEGELDANGVRIHYYRRGVGRALVLAHGMTDNGKCWSRLATVLEDRFDIVAYDARYHGPVSYTHLRAHETVLDLVCRLLLEKKKTKTKPSVP